jgi:hypothetical protein
METNTYYLLGAGFVVLTGIMYWILFNVFRNAIARTGWDAARKQTVIHRFRLVFIGWAAILLLVASTGFFSDFSTFPPRIMIVLIVPLVTIILFTRSHLASELLPNIPAKSLLHLQSFRIPVEILIWGAFVIGELPVQMTFEGRNLDMLSGVAGPIVALFFINNRAVVYFYNLTSLGLLINIVTIAILSLPTPIRVFMNDPANVLVTKAPFILLPGMLVPLAYGLAFLSLRQLGVQRKD